MENSNPTLNNGSPVADNPAGSTSNTPSMDNHDPAQAANTGGNGTNKPSDSNTSSAAAGLLNTSNINWETKLTAGWIVFVTIVLFVAYIIINIQLDKRNSICFAVYWNNPDSLIVNPGPSWFQYDQKTDTLRSMIIIDDTSKSLLLGLAKDTTMGVTDSLVTTSKDSYYQAIEALAFKSNAEKRSSYYLLLLLFAVCGAFGSQLRMIYRFIGVTCYKRIFDFKIWWPWYFLLPLLGAVIGPILFMLVEGNLLNYTTTANYSNFLIALSIVSGFAADDFVRKLNLISEALWGDSKSVPDNGSSSGTVPGKGTNAKPSDTGK